MIVRLDPIILFVKRLKAMGTRIAGPPKKMPWGVWETSFLDPDGNEFDVIQPRVSQESTRGHPQMHPPARNLYAGALSSDNECASRTWDSTRESSRS